jgi:hypothetical protein
MDSRWRRTNEWIFAGTSSEIVFDMPGSIVGMGSLCFADWYQSTVAEESSSSDFFFVISLRTFPGQFAWRLGRTRMACRGTRED